MIANNMYYNSHPPNAKQRTPELLLVTILSPMVGKIHTIKKGPKIIMIVKLYS